MKNLLDELGFEHLPMMTEFIEELEKPAFGEYCKRKYRKLLFNGVFALKVRQYKNMITQPLKEGMFELIDMPHMTLHQSCILADDKSTIEQVINSGIELKLKP